jgi:N-acetylmuramoyl-L-alanine amidase
MPSGLFLLIFVHLLALSTATIAQERHWREKSNDSLFLRIVLPSDGDTVDAGRVRFAGATDSAAQVAVNGQSRRVYPSGAFVGLVPLAPGENRLVFAATRGSFFLRDTVRVFRRPPVKPLPPEPTAIVPSSVEPLRDVSLSAGDELRVRFRGSPSGRAQFEIKKIAKKIPMRELSPEETNGIAGLYEGVYRLPARENYKPEKIRFKLRGIDGDEIKFESPGRISLLPDGIPMMAMTADTNNILRVAPGGAILTELPMGIKLRVVGREGETARVCLAREVEAYTSLANLKMLPAGAQPPLSRVGGISTSVSADWIRLRITMSERVPFKVQQFLAPQALEVTFYSAAQGSEWTTYPLQDSTLNIIQWRQEASDRYVLRVELNQRQQWGYYGEYNGNNFLLSIRREPQLAPAPDSPMSGLRIAVDAGHGGEEPGSIGATGLMEKDVNLRYALKVADLLEQRGAMVTRIRAVDTTMTLRSRMLKARAANAQLFVWLHNNSIGAAADPEATRGTSTYYTVPQGLEISRKVYPHLLSLGLAPSGNIASTYYVTRQTDMLIFLVEGAFLSNPEDEMLLLDDAFLDKLAAAVVAGIEDFLDGLRPKMTSNGVLE